MAVVDICYITSHGFASRMLTQTDLLGRLRAAGLTVALIAPDKNDPFLKAYCAQRDIILEEFEAKSSLFAEDYLFKRRYYLEDIRSNVALWEKHMAATRYHKARNPLKRIRPYYYALMNSLIPRFPGIRERFVRGESRYLRSPEAEALLARLRPGKLISTYPVNLSDAILLHYAKKSGETETWIHLLSWDNITCKGRFVETADQYIAWGPVMRDELKTHYGVPDERIHMCGVPHFDVHLDPRAREIRPELLRSLGIDPAQPYVLFAMSAPRFAPNEIDIVEWLAARVADRTYGPLQLLVRPHPQNVQGNMSDRSWLERLRGLNDLQHVVVAFPKMVQSRMRWSMESDDMMELAAMLSGASTVLNSGSTVSIDALMHQKPVLITAFDGDTVRDYWDSARRLMDYAHLRKLADLGGVRITRSFDELDQGLRRYIADPQADSVERASTLAMECYARDGRATDRVVRVLLRELVPSAEMMNFVAGPAERESALLGDE